MDDANILLQSVFDHSRSVQLRKLREINFDAKEVFADVDDQYTSLKDSLCSALNQMSAIEGFTVYLSELTEFVTPYLMHEYLSDNVCSESVQLFDFAQSTTLKELADYIFESQKESSECDQQILISNAISSAL